MKTFGTILSAAFVLMPWIVDPLVAQQNNDPNKEKKITITKRLVDEDGTETTEIIVKRGKAAEAFDVQQYIDENNSDEVSELNVQVEGGGDDDRTVIVRRPAFRNARSNGFVTNNNGDVAITGFLARSSKAFLGVEEDSDEDSDEAGLVVQIIRGSAADEAGLHDNDKILSLNGEQIDRWNDLSKFMRDMKPGDKVEIRYSRNGKETETEATLTTRDEVKKVKASPTGFLGVSEEDDDEDEPGVRVRITKNSGAEKAGLYTGDVITRLNDTEINDFEDITDFMAYTRPGESVRITYMRDGKKNTAKAVLGEQKSWDWDNWNMGNLKLDDIDINIREKEACLGVYTGVSEEDETTGAQITNFTPESAAMDAQMQVGDLITGVNGQHVNGHSELWDEIAKYDIGETVSIEYQRDNQPMVTEVTLKACRDNSGRVQLWDTDEEGDNRSRRFFIWNWSDDERQSLRERRVITIRRGAEGDSPKVNAAPDNQPVVQDHSLQLASYHTFPNPTEGPVTVEFKSDPLPTIVSLFDMNGRQLFREELNAFNGEYSQQFDLSEYSKGTIIVHILQEGKVFTDQVVIH
ncbi:MAG: PDZ domain-containing protein [Lewinellaceae bacterium]|nr:PDZ domain-containing protein [Lewinellaceae bacterium]